MQADVKINPPIAGRGTFSLMYESVNSMLVAFSMYRDSKAKLMSEARGDLGPRRSDNIHNMR